MVVVVVVVVVIVVVVPKVKMHQTILCIFKMHLNICIDVLYYGI